jgi:hypothetical protein
MRGGGGEVLARALQRVDVSRARDEQALGRSLPAASSSSRARRASSPSPVSAETTRPSSTDAERCRSSLL